MTDLTRRGFMKAGTAAGADRLQDVHAGRGRGQGLVAFNRCDHQ